jgi:membrane-bound serine protease (ClpP class)
VLILALILLIVPIYSSLRQSYLPEIIVTSSFESGFAKQVYVIQLYEEIDQGSAAMIARGIHDANSANATAVIIDMNTPGGILGDMLTMIGAINSSKIPVYTFVGNFSSAASAGSYVAMATDKIYMSNSSVIGPSTPYIIGGTSLEQAHVANYTLALMVDMAQVHGRNTTAVAEMAANNTAFTGIQANQYHVSDGYSGSLSQTLNLINASGASITTISENPSEQVLTFLAGNATLDGILLILGIVAIAIDFFHPTIILSIAGAVLIILALIGEEAIQGPSNYEGLLIPVLLYIVAATLIILEIKTGHGFMLFAGVIVGAIGTYLFAYQVEYVGASPTGTLEYLEIGILIFAGGLLALYARYIGKTIRAKPVTGEESLIGAKATVYSDSITVDSAGEITVNGVVWRARLANPNIAVLKKGDTVVVTRVEGLTLVIDRQVGSPQEWKKVG